MRVMTSKASEASEVKIHIILSKEWKINRYGPWIFHKNIFNHRRERFHVRPWLSSFTEARGSYDVDIIKRLCSFLSVDPLVSVVLLPLVGRNCAVDAGQGG